MLKNENKITVDVFISENDPTVLRWITELHTCIRPYQEFVIINVHNRDTNNMAKQLHLSTDTILLNEKLVQFHNLEIELVKMAKKFLDEF